MWATLAARMGFDPRAEESCGVLAKLLVFGCKGGAEMAVNVQLADDFSRDENGHDDFGLSFERAC